MFFVLVHVFKEIPCDGGLLLFIPPIDYMHLKRTLEVCVAKFQGNNNFMLHIALQCMAAVTFLGGVHPGQG